MKTTPVLSIIIASFNTSKITVDCLKSIFQDKGLDFKGEDNSKTPSEIIIVDNNSSDDSVAQIKELFNLKKIENYELIVNKENVGFSKANNQGIRAARGNYILLLNSDTIILHSAISQSLDWLSSHPEANICTGQLLNADGTIQASGGFFPNLINVLAWCFSFDDLPLFNSFIPPFHPHTPQFYTHDSFFLFDHRQDWVTGAYMLTRKNILDKAGLFDENYFMYGEEYELTYRMHLVDPAAQTWYLVGPQIIHLGGASAPTRSRPLFQEYQGVMAFFDKHKPRWQYKIVKAAIKINRLARIIIYTILGRQETAALYTHETI